jgi:hypothetical protein
VEPPTRLKKHPLSLFEWEGEKKERGRKSERRVKEGRNNLNK